MTKARRAMKPRAPRGKKEKHMLKHQSRADQTSPAPTYAPPRAAVASPNTPPPAPPIAAEVDSIARCLDELGRYSDSLVTCVILAKANADLVAGAQPQGDEAIPPLGGGLVEQFRARLGRLDNLISALGYELDRSRTAIEGCS